MSQSPIESRAELAQRSGSPSESGCQRPAEAAASHMADLSSMCHELRTPMNIVIGMTWLLQHSGLNPIQQDYLREIQGASDQLLRIISQLLGDARPGLGAEPARPRDPPDCAESGTAANDPTTAPGWCGQEPPDSYQDKARWEDLRLQLTTLLGAADTDCIRLASEHRSLLRVMFGVEYEAWSQALHNFDFDLALSLIEVLC